MPPSSGQEYNYLQNRPHFQSYYLYPNNLANPETTTEVDLLYIFLHGMRSTKCTIESVALGLVYLHEDSSFEPWIQSMCLCWALAKSPPDAAGRRNGRHDFTWPALPKNTWIALSWHSLASLSILGHYSLIRLTNGDLLSLVGLRVTISLFHM